MGNYIMSGRFPPLRFARNQVGASEPTISANNLQSQKPARPGYYGQSIGHDISDEFEFSIKSDRTNPIKLVSSKNVSYQPLCTLGHLKTAIQSYIDSRCTVAAC
jgi:hypothetical protein